MLKVESRESAHVRSRVKDLSAVPNVVDYTGLFAAITPISKVKPVDGVYAPVLIRDTEELIATFGDPRIDPEKYIDLYNIMQMVGDGTSCYIAKVNSGTTGIFDIVMLPNASPSPITMVAGDEAGLVWVSPDATSVIPVSVTVTDGGGDPTVIGGDKYSYKYNDDGKLEITFQDAQTGTVKVANSADSSSVITAYSSMTDNVSINCKLTKAKPFSLGIRYLAVQVKIDDEVLAEAKIKLHADTILTNQGLVNALNSKIGTYTLLELADPKYASASQAVDSEHSIIKSLLDVELPLPEPGPGVSSVVIRQDATFSVPLANYKAALEQYNDTRYPGCIMADMTAPMTDGENFGAPSESDRRSLHYYLKMVAAERKDCTVLLSTPLCESLENQTQYTWEELCDWVSSTGPFEDHFEYGETNTTDYTLQSFYLEMYASWLEMNCTKVNNNGVSSVRVKLAPAGVVAANILRSYRERAAVHYPVAGDQYGVLPENCYVVNNPAKKAERDLLVQYRINPIYDTGTRGVQIYGNETLNAGYTDLNAAHIARTLVRVRSLVDAYTETLKFSISNELLYGTWISHVSYDILDPIRSLGGITTYTVAMGPETTSAEELANRIVNGRISLQFPQSAEIFDLTFTVFSSATATE